MSDVELIGRPLGKRFNVLRKKHHDDIPMCLKRTMDQMAGGFASIVDGIEKRSHHVDWQRYF